MKTEEFELREKDDLDRAMERFYERSGNRALIFKQDNQLAIALEISVSVTALNCALIRTELQPSQESRIRDFFKTLGIAPQHDLVIGNQQTRILAYPISQERDHVAEITHNLLKHLFNLGANNPVSAAIEVK
jgi:hypothetical protein